MEESMIHKAVVERISSHSALLRLLSGGDCGGCRLAAVCGGDAERTVRVSITGPGQLHVGAEVEVVAAPRARFRAIWLFTVAPLLSLIAGAWLVDLAGGSEPLMALGALAAAGLCLLLLYLLRGRLTGGVVWKIVDYD